MSLFESVLDEPGGGLRECRRIAPRESGFTATRQRKESAHDRKDSLGLLRDRFHGASRAIVQLFG